MTENPLRLSLGTILGASIVSCLVVGLFVFMRLDQSQDNTTVLFAEKAEALFTVIEAGVRSNQRANSDFEGALKAIVEELDEQADTRFIAITDAEGRIIAHTNKKFVGSVLFSPLDMDLVAPNRFTKWVMINFFDGDAFLVYREFTPLRDLPKTVDPRQPELNNAALDASQTAITDPVINPTTEPTIEPDLSVHAHTLKSSPEATPELALDRAEAQKKRFRQSSSGLGLAPVIFVAYDPASYLQAQKDNERQDLLESSVLILMGLIALVLIFWRENFSKTRRLLGDTRAFAKEIVANFPDGLIVLGTNSKPLYINSTARRLLELVSGKQHFTNNRLEQIGSNKQAEILKENLNFTLPDFVEAAFLKLKENNFEGSQEVFFDGLPTPKVEGQELLEPQLANNVYALDKRYYFEIRAIRVGRESSISQAKWRKNKKIIPVSEHIADILIIRNQTKIKSLQKKLRKNEKLAAIGNLAAGVAHEIRNPLSSIKGYATIFSNLFSSHSQEQEIALAIIKETERLNRAISNLLDISNTAALRLSTVNLKTLLAHTILLVNADAHKKNIVIKEYLEDVGDKKLDQDKIIQAILNLLLNAIDAMPNGGQLSLSLASLPAESQSTPIANAVATKVLDGSESQSTVVNNNRVRIIVADSGSGISEDILAKIFDPYFTTKADGTGLGLAMTQNIIEAHEGKIEVISNQQGTAFKIILP